MRIEYMTEVTQFITIVIHFEWKPIFLIIYSVQLHSTLSKALLVSSFRAIEPIFPLLL